MRLRPGGARRGTAGDPGAPIRVLPGLVAPDELAALRLQDGAVATTVGRRAARRAGERDAPAQITTEMHTARPGDTAPGWTVPGPGGRPASPTDAVVLHVALDDLRGHEGQVRLLLPDHGPSGSRIADVPLAPGDAVLTAGWVPATRHRNHGRAPTSILRLRWDTQGDASLLPTQEPFASWGFRARPLLDDGQVAGLRRLVDRYADRPGFFVSRRDVHGTQARSIDLAVKELIDERLRAAVPGHRVLFASICAKPRLSDEPVPFHQDLTCTDEREHRAVFAWIPLVDVTEDDGGLLVVPGSHRWSTGIRADQGGGRDIATDRHQEGFGHLAVAMRLRAGDALLFDGALVHGSGPNRRDRPRPALTVVLLPEGAPVQHFHACDDGGLVGHLVDDAFFTAHAFAERPRGYPTLEPWAAPVSAGDFEAPLARAADR